MKPQKNTQTSWLLLSALSAMMFLSALACNLPFPASDSLPVADAQPAESEPVATQDIQNQRATAQAAAPEVAATQEEDADTAPDDTEPADGGPILPGDTAAIPDCNAFDVNAFDTIIEGSFAFVMQDQLNNCHYESDNGYRLLIGGGKPSSDAEMEAAFNTAFGALPDSTWEAIDDYYLGLAFSSVSVTAQGVSSSGHTMVIVAASQPGLDPDVLQQIFENLARESARQLNAQW